MFPVPAAVALIDIGDPASRSFDGDGYFDTATWGDLGGNLFVARFLEPGRPRPDHRPGHQLVRRAHLRGAAAAPTTCSTPPGASPFFFMTANAFDPQGKALHTYVGSGNRERHHAAGRGLRTGQPPRLLPRRLLR